MGVRVRAGTGVSFMLDSGYMPLTGTMCRSDGSVLG